MLIVIFDNNIVIDALKPNTQFEKEAQEILRLSVTRKICGLVTANSLTDIFYVLRKEHGAEKAKLMAKQLTVMLDIVDVTAEDCVDALALPMNDFEDALIAVCARKVGADCIVTRDDMFMKSAAAGVKVINPDELLATVR